MVKTMTEFEKLWEEYREGHRGDRGDPVDQEMVRNAAEWFYEAGLKDGLKRAVRGDGMGKAWARYQEWVRANK